MARKIDIQVRTFTGWRTHYVTETFDKCKDAKAHYCGCLIVFMST